MVATTRRQFLRGALSLGASCGAGLLAACGQPDPIAGSTGGLGGQSVPVTPVGATASPATPGTPGYLPTPTAIPTSVGTVIIPDTPIEPYPRSGIRTPIILQSPLPYSTPAPNDPHQVTIMPARDGNPRLPAMSNQLIVTATILEVRAARWTTPDGRRPANPHGVQNPYGIYTPMFAQVNQILKGTISSVTLPVIVPGGMVANDYIRYGDGIFDFVVGQKVVLFLQPRTLAPVDLDGIPAWQVSYRYTITAEQTATNSYQSLPLQELLNTISNVIGTPMVTPQIPSPVATPRQP